MRRVAAFAEITLAVVIVSGMLAWASGVSLEAIVQYARLEVTGARVVEYDVVCPGWGPGSRILGISGDATALGDARDPDNHEVATIWEDGESTYLHTGPTMGHAVVEDYFGRVVTNLYLGHARERICTAVVAPPGGQATPLEIPDGYCSCRACDANDAGIVVGTVVPRGEPGRPCTWDATGAATVLDSARGCASAINDSGIIVGYVDVPGGQTMRLWRAHGEGWCSMDVIAPVAGNVRPEAISDEGVVVGRVFAQGAFRWDETEGLRMLRDPTGAKNGQARDVNNRGEVVGSGMHRKEAVAVLWREDEVIDLNDRIDPELGWHLTNGTAISDTGVIACTGMRGDRQEVVVLIPRALAG
ncbi:MAG: hypothetical protein ACOX9R_09030 [Armatimonadota bacterium]|jgi:hypothetical protein